MGGEGRFCAIVGGGKDLAEVGDGVDLAFVGLAGFLPEGGGVVGGGFAEGALLFGELLVEGGGVAGLGDGFAGFVVDLDAGAEVVGYDGVVPIAGVGFD